jgi:hypothetical protein
VFGWFGAERGAPIFRGVRTHGSADPVAQAKTDLSKSKTRTGAPNSLPNGTVSSNSTGDIEMHGRPSSSTGPVPAPDCGNWSTSHSRCPIIRIWYCGPMTTLASRSTIPAESPYLKSRSRDKFNLARGAQSARSLKHRGQPSADKRPPLKRP